MKTALIIGAGPSGLTAAYYFLTMTNIQPVLIEKENYIGGISRTVDYKGNRMDLGGHRFFSKDQEILALWQKLLPLQGAPAYDDRKLNRQVRLAPGGPDPEETDNVLLVRRRVSRILYTHRFFDYPLALCMKTLQNLGLIRTGKILAGYLCACIHKVPEKNLAGFMINRFGKPLYQMFFRDYTEKVWGRSPERIDASWGSQRIRGLSLRSILADLVRKLLGAKKADNTEVSLIENFYYPKFGPGQLWEKLRCDIVGRGGRLLLSVNVKQFYFSTENTISSLRIECEGKEQIISCDYVLSSMPIPALLQAIGRQKFPADIWEIAQQLPYRDFITAGVLVSRLKIKNETKLKTLANIVPDCWIYVQEPEVKLGRIQIFNNWSPYMVQRPDDTVWLGLEYFCSETDTLWSMDEDTFLAFAEKELELLGIVDRSDVQDAVRIKVPRAYPAYFGSYRNFGRVRAAIDSISNLYCIGRNGQHRYNNMDHSMLTAIRAVECIVTDGDKKNIWNVNAGQEYQERG